MGFHTIVSAKKLTNRARIFKSIFFFSKLYKMHGSFFYLYLLGIIWP